MERHERDRRMRRVKYGDDPVLKFADHCFEWENKNYILRDDKGAARYRVVRMNADVARSVTADDLLEDHFKRNNERLAKKN